MSITSGNFQGDIVDMLYNKDPLGLQDETEPIDSNCTRNNSVPAKESILIYHAQHQPMVITTEISTLGDVLPSHIWCLPSLIRSEWHSSGSYSPQVQNP